MSGEATMTENGCSVIYAPSSREYLGSRVEPGWYRLSLGVIQYGRYRARPPRHALPAG